MSKYKNYITIFLPIVLIIGALIVVSTTKKPQQSQSEPSTLNIVCTTNIIEQTLINLIQSPNTSSSQPNTPSVLDHISLTTLMGPGTDPHLYRATENDVTTLQKADVIFYNGLHLEYKLTDILEQLAKQKRVVAISQDIDRNKLISPPEYEGNYDPHIWFDLSLWKQTVITMKNTLIKADPSNKHIYTNNTNNYLNQLNQLETSLRQTINTLPTKNRILITAHDAFNYFGNAFGFTVKGLQGISTQAEPSIKDIENLANYIATKKVKSIFVESSVPKRTIQAVQEATKALNWQVSIGGELFSDALGSANTPEGTYTGMIKHNITTIVENLK